MPTSHALSHLRSARAGRADFFSLPPPAATQRSDLRGARGALRRILVATDGTAASDGALAVAGLLARRNGAAVDVLTVLPRWGPPPPAHEFLDMTGDLLESRLARVIPQGTRALGADGTPWTVTLIDSSSVVGSIASVADARSHELIVTGMRSGWVRRWLRRPTALGVAQRSDVPVLVVPPSVDALPSRAVIGVNGTDDDVAIAASTGSVRPELSAIHLVHVRTSDESLANGRTGEGGTRPVGWATRFSGIERVLDAAEITEVQRAVLPGGDPATRLLGYATTRGADLIVVGSRRPASLEERILGGVSRRILRMARCCVLIRGLESAGSSR